VHSINERIYEKLRTEPEPDNYSGKIPWIVQQQIGATNGVHYVDTIGKLQEYPIPEIPVGEGRNNQLLLDIGCGWGRWLVASSRKNFIPVGIDLRLEFCEIARQVVSENGSNAYTVVADLQELPFQDNVFDVVWSFSVIQHTHYNRMISCLREIQRILNTDGYCFLEFPNKNGFRNRFGPASASNNMEFESWDVRYYTPDEYRNIFLEFFKDFEFSTHSMLGIGILPGDFKYARGFKNKAIISVSRLFTELSNVIKPLKEYADSIYIKADKKGIVGESTDTAKIFLQKHSLNPADNLNIVHLLRCPNSGYPLILSEDRAELICQKAGIAYPVRNSIPIVVSSESRSL
jgi:SAM-dependent methyltransferase/uncharacterized protein YbaR (Trm112 family)